MSKANVCPRCLKDFGAYLGGIHTCTPTEFSRSLEGLVDRYREALERIARNSRDREECRCFNIANEALGK